MGLPQDHQNASGEDVRVVQTSMTLGATVGATRSDSGQTVGGATVVSSSPTPLSNAARSDATHSAASPGGGSSGSGGGGGASGSTRTTTSRRGGRSRTRSPINMILVPREGGIGPDAGGTGVQTTASASPSPRDYGRPETDHSAISAPSQSSQPPANPSSAAAAAAAAAKAFQGQEHSWFDSHSTLDRDTLPSRRSHARRDYPRSREGQHDHSFHSQRPVGRIRRLGDQGRTLWPGEEEDDDDRRDQRFSFSRGDGNSEGADGIDSGRRTDNGMRRIMGGPYMNQQQRRRDDSRTTDSVFRERHNKTSAYGSEEYPSYRNEQRGYSEEYRRGSPDDYTNYSRLQGSDDDPRRGEGGNEMKSQRKEMYAGKGRHDDFHGRLSADAFTSAADRLSPTPFHAGSRGPHQHRPVSRDQVGSQWDDSRTFDESNRRSGRGTPLSAKSASPSSVTTVYRTNRSSVDVDVSCSDDRGKSDDGIHEPSASQSAPRRTTGGTSRIMGTSTPIHMPRATGPSNAKEQKKGDPASVFRERPRETPAAGDDECAPKMLLSLRTPTTSFEERDDLSKIWNRKPNDGAAEQSESIPPPSPEEPPRIQHSHNQNQAKSDPLSFEPQRSPRLGDQSGVQQSANANPTSASSIEMTPSFNLFNQSFDSLGDSQYINVGGSLESSFHQPSSFGGGPSVDVDGNQANSALPSNILRSTSATSNGPCFSGPDPTTSQPINDTVSGNQQYLSRSESGAAPSMSMLGMSPVNSFGNGVSSAQPESGNTLVLGGSVGLDANGPVVGFSSFAGPCGGQESVTDTKSNRLNGVMDSHSPRVVSTYSSSERGASRPHSGSASPARHVSVLQPSPRPAIPSRASTQASSSHIHSPAFYGNLCGFKNAFNRCSFLLPGLKEALRSSKNSPDRLDCRPDNVKTKSQGSNVSQEHHKGQYQHNELGTQSETEQLFGDSAPTDTEIAVRRVTSAVCAFGGSYSAESNRSSIFRGNGEEPDQQGTKASQSQKARIKYEELLPNRFYENENRLSWEIEEVPPVEMGSDEETSEQQVAQDTERTTQKRPASEGENSRTPRQNKKCKLSKKESSDQDTPSSSDQPSSPGTVKSASGSEGSKGRPGVSSPSGSDQPKMRYRCKLCGQPKQNHTCPYQQSLQRSIGVMIYPAINAFTSTEPGLLAPALSEMNNFVSSGSEPSSTETSPSRPTPDRSILAAPPSSGVAPPSQAISSSPHNVTPETMRSGMHGQSVNHLNSPGSSLSTGSGTPQTTPFRRSCGSASRLSGTQARIQSNYSGGARISHNQSSIVLGGGRKRSYHRPYGGFDDDSVENLFVDGTELRPEQYRIVTPTKQSATNEAYKFPALPLPYAQRKRLSDNLFALSKEIPCMTDECARVLREAREKDMWDLAVAELMTQVVVVVHCPEGDVRLDGLRQYLLKLGIAC